MGIGALEEAAQSGATYLGINIGYTFLGNSVGAYLGAFVVFIFGLVVFKMLQWAVLRWLAALAKRTKTDLDDTFIKIVRSFRPPFYLFLSFWFATRSLVLVGLLDNIVTGILIAWLVYQAVVAAGILTEDVLFKRFAKDRDPTTKSALRLVVGLVKGALWGLGVILLFSNLGVDVSSLLAGVGIGGLAVAFALQGVLSDLFASFSIYFDKPFKVGDFIVIGNTMGTVKHIGIKSTRLQSLGGEEITLSNQELTSVRIQNFKRMEERRVVFGFGILYATPYEKLAQVGEMVRDIIGKVPQTRFDRAHFLKFGDSSYDFEAVYYVLDPDYNTYMDTQEKINLGVVKRFGEEGIEFAFPTRTIHTIAE